MKFKLENKTLKKIKKILNENQFEAYFVGGYVRDNLLGLDSKDIDIMIAGDAVKAANTVAREFRTKLTAVYKRFGAALVSIEGLKIEFASARKESYSPDSRKPKIEFSGLQDDLSRRDFTINALAISLKKNSKIIDLFEGLNDLKNKLIKTPLEPNKTFSDDPLRMLRAIRFASYLGFSITPETFKAIKSNRNRLSDTRIVSQERITNELMLILQTKKPSIAFNLLYLSGLLEFVFPELEKMPGVEQREDYHHKDVFYHSLEVLDKVAEKSDNVWLRFSALLHDIGKPKTKKFIKGTGWTFHGHDEIGARMIKKIFMRLKLPMNKLNYVEKLVRLHLRPIPLSKEEVTDSAIRRLAVDAGEDLQDLLLLCRADITSKTQKKVEKYIRNFDIVELKILEVQEKDKLRSFQSPVRGDEIMKICKIPPSKKVGLIKKKIEEAILEGIIPNEYNAAKNYLCKIKDKYLKGNKD